MTWIVKNKIKTISLNFIIAEVTYHLTIKKVKPYSKYFPQLSKINFFSQEIIVFN